MQNVAPCWDFWVHTGQMSFPSGDNSGGFFSSLFSFDMGDGFFIASTMVLSVVPALSYRGLWQSGMASLQPEAKLYMAD